MIKALSTIVVEGSFLNLGSDTLKKSYSKQQTWWRSVETFFFDTGKDLCILLEVLSSVVKPEKEIKAIRMERKKTVIFWIWHERVSVGYFIPCPNFLCRTWSGFAGFWPLEGVTVHRPWGRSGLRPQKENVNSELLQARSVQVQSFQKSFILGLECLVQFHKKRFVFLILFYLD